MIRRTVPLLALVLVAAAWSAAGALDATLAPDGTLYQARIGGDGFSLVIRLDGAEEPEVVPVPVTPGHFAVSPLLERDPVSGAVVVVWQESDGDGLDQVKLATFRDGLWSGPVWLGGSVPRPALNPSMVVYVREAPAAPAPEREDGEDAAPAAVPESMVVVSWWEGFGDDPDASAVVLAVPLDEEGRPREDAWLRKELRSGYSYGVVCPASEHWQELAHPQVVLDEGSGEPAVLFPDFGQCLLNVVRVGLVDQDPGDDGPGQVTGQRRRTILVLNTDGQVPIPPRLDLGRARVTLASGLRILAYWPDEDGQAFSYLVSRGDEWSEPHRLPFSDDLTPEKALLLLQGILR